MAKGPLQAVHTHVGEKDGEIKISVTFPGLDRHESDLVLEATFAKGDSVETVVKELRWLADELEDAGK